MNDDSVFGNYYQPSNEASQLPADVDYSVWDFNYDISECESSDHDDLPELIVDDSDNFSSADHVWHFPQVEDIERILHALDESEEKQAYQTKWSHSCRLYYSSKWQYC